MAAALVVNCFQIVSLTYWTQPRVVEQIRKSCCELLSDCIFDLLNTTTPIYGRSPQGLWIAFRLYLWLIEHNDDWYKELRTLVVNCFQIVSLTYWTQRKTIWWCALLRCELLSDCIFDLLNTTYRQYTSPPFPLWIAFRLYLWLIEHNASRTRCPTPLVVNCFQIVSLTYWTQRLSVASSSVSRCELLSDCIFDLLNTTTGS